MKRVAAPLMVEGINLQLEATQDYDAARRARGSAGGDSTTPAMAAANADYQTSLLLIQLAERHGVKSHAPALMYGSPSVGHAVMKVFWRYAPHLQAGPAAEAVADDAPAPAAKWRPSDGHVVIPKDWSDAARRPASESHPMLEMQRAAR